MADHGERAGATALPAGAAGWDAALRVLSLALAAALGLILFFSPWLFAGEEILVQAIMPVMALGLAGAVVHGIGVRPRSMVLAAVFGPWVAWPVILSSLALLAFRFG